MFNALLPDTNALFIATTEWLMTHIGSVVFFTVLATVAADLIVVAARRRTRTAGDQASRSANSVRTSVAAGFIYAGVKGVISKVLMFGVALWVHDRFGIFELSVTIWWTWLALFIGRDFVYYWVHRAEHRFAAMWASHMIHHSSEEFSFTTAVRMPWMESLYKPVLYLWAPLLGFHPAAAAVLGGLVLIAGQVQHTELGGRFAPIERMFVTPSVHRVHHGSNPQYLDKNFGSMLTVWDHLFGTFEPECEPVCYGLTGEKSVVSVRDALVGGYSELAVDLRRSSNPRTALAVLTARPS